MVGSDNNKGSFVGVSVVKSRVDQLVELFHPPDHLVRVVGVRRMVDVRAFDHREETFLVLFKNLERVTCQISKEIRIDLSLVQLAALIKKTEDRSRPGGIERLRSLHVSESGVHCLVDKILIGIFFPREILPAPADYHIWFEFNQILCYFLPFSTFVHMGIKSSRCGVKNVGCHNDSCRKPFILS